MNETIVNPADPSQTFTFGKRGRRPQWVQDYIKLNPSVGGEKTEKKDGINPVTTTGEQGQPGLFKWTLKSNSSCCICVAPNELLALKILNRTFRPGYEVSGRELSQYWSKSEDDGLLPEGVWEFVNDNWVRRTEKLTLDN